jgi:2-polyprenyl-6-methoxyphenol hydroxylase-like FAD-dependent oxidoreductase
MEAFRKSIVEIEPGFARHVESLTEWHQCSLLSVESSRCPVWYKQGLLLIGDAAHVMSPVGGVGINYAVQDAVVAVNVLSRTLRNGQISVQDLADVQSQREWPTRVIQAIQSTLQTRVIAGALQVQGTLRIPWFVWLFFRIPILRNIPARILAFGVRKVRLQEDS